MLKNYFPVCRPDRDLGSQTRDLVSRGVPEIGPEYSGLLGGLHFGRELTSLGICRTFTSSSLIFSRRRLRLRNILLFAGWSTRSRFQTRVLASRGDTRVLGRELLGGVKPENETQRCHKAARRRRAGDPQLRIRIIRRPGQKTP